MIADVVITPLKQICDRRGKVMHMLRSDSPIFMGFGEIYFSCIYPGMVKAWKLHREMTLNCAVPHGLVKFVMYDDRPNSLTRGEIQEIVTGPDHYCLITVPPMIWTGFQCIGQEMAILANCATVGHDRAEAVTQDPSASSIPYEWSINMNATVDRY